MSFMTLSKLELAPWYVAGIYWAISALRVKRTKVMEGPGDRLFHTGLMGMAFVLLFSHRLELGSLDLRFVPESAWLRVSGMFLTNIGAGIAIWARYSLGQYWSARVTLKVDHRLIRSGPYAYIRHPLYAGLLVAMAGTALVVGEWRAVIGVLLGLMELSRKAAKEEALLATEFSEDYPEYRKHAGFLTPRFRQMA
jgi:protein-S-isoprenylcysteine O-methyltransferase Ste14